MKKVVILFGDRHLSYSPTVIGLYDQLSPKFDVTIVAKSPETFDNKPLPNRNVVYIKPEKTEGFYKYPSRIKFELSSLFKKEVAALKGKNIRHNYLHEFYFIKDFLERNNPDFIIAVDFKNLAFMQIMNKRVEFLSLEINVADKFREDRDFQNINSVIIQTKERYEHLFKDKKHRTFFIQNAPVYTPEAVNPRRTGLVYCGTAWDAFGFYHLLEFLKKFPANVLTVKGAMLSEDQNRVQAEYQHLISGRQLVIDNDYLDDTEVVGYLRKFRIGFCFYNFDVDWINNFNYFSAPAGKMFKYLAAGVPVVGVDTPGMRPVSEFDCGVLVDDMSPASIKGAIDKIEDNFDRYSQNCLNAAEHYSFDKAVKPFIDYLSNSNN